MDPHQESAFSCFPRTLLMAAVIALVALAVYWPSLRGGFLWDDDMLLTDNPLVKSTDGFTAAWTSTTSEDYFPLVTDSFWLEYRLWGNRATGFRVTNVLLHAIGAILLWRVLLRLRVPGAW